MARQAKAKVRNAVDIPLPLQVSRLLAQALDGWLDAPPASLRHARAAAYSLGKESCNWEREQSLLLERVTIRIQF